MKTLEKSGRLSDLDFRDLPFFVLYLIQGIPHGLLAGLPLIFKEAGVSYSKIGGFSLVASLPFCLQLLMAPLIDWFPYSRRKTWVSCNSLCALLLWKLSEDSENLAETPWFGFLSLTASLRDIATSQQALNGCDPQRLGHLSLWEALGKRIGFGLGYGMVFIPWIPLTIEGYLQGLAVLTLGLTSVVWSIRNPAIFCAPSAGIWWSYRRLWTLLSLKGIHSLVPLLLVARITYLPFHSYMLKLQEKGVPKHVIGTSGLLNVPLSLGVPFLLSDISPSWRMEQCWGHYFVIGLMGFHVFWSTSESPVLLVFLFRSLTLSLASLTGILRKRMFNQLAQADPAMSATYIAFLTSMAKCIHEFGKYLSLRSNDFWTFSPFQQGSGGTLWHHLWGLGDESLDGFVCTCVLSLAFGLITHRWAQKTVQKLEMLPTNCWRLSTFALSTV